jgi:hypothetical protein
MNEANMKKLRKVDDTDAFYFYKALDIYTGEKANSIKEFLQKIKGIDAESLEFHLYREDFEKWMASTIGDADLAGRIKALRVQKITAEKNLRDRLSLLISEHIKKLKAIPSEKEIRKTQQKTLQRPKRTESELERP